MTVVPARAEGFLRLCGALLLACGAPAIPRNELPSAPIAFIRQLPSARKISLAELREALRSERPGETAASRPALATELSLLIPTTGEITPVPGAMPGDLPLDWSGDRSRLLVGRRASATRGLELYTWNRLTGAWSQPFRELASSGAAWGDGSIRAVWDSLARGPGGAPVYKLRILREGVGAADLGAGGGGIDPDLAPDGRSVVFASRGLRDHQGDGVILIARLDALEPLRLGRGSSPRFSRDGRWIVFTRGPAGGRDVWLMRADGRARRALTASALYDEDHPSLSPDGSWVTYSSARGARQESQLYAMHLSDGRELQLTLRGQNAWPLW